MPSAIQAPIDPAWIHNYKPPVLAAPPSTPTFTPRCPLRAIHSQSTPHTEGYPLQSHNFSPLSSPPRVHEHDLAALALGFSSAPNLSHPLSIPIHGTLPPYLAGGAYFRIGPGLFEATHADGAPYTPTHWFDGLAVLHKFAFALDATSIQCSNKLTSQPLLRAIQSSRKDDYLAVRFSPYTPARGLAWFRRVFGRLTRDPVSRLVPSNMSVRLSALPKRGLLNARADDVWIQQLDPAVMDTVDTFEYKQYSRLLDGGLCPAHEILDRETGDIYNVMIELGPGKVAYKVFQISADGQTNVLASFKDYMRYIHSFSLTENFVVLTICPSRIDLKQLLLTKSVLKSLSFCAESAVRFVVIRRNGEGIVAEYTHENFFFLHTINAYELHGDIVIDLSRLENTNVLHDYTIDKMKSGKQMSKAKPARFVLSNISAAIAAGPSQVQKATGYFLSNIQFEMGSVSPTVEGRRHRYMYGISEGDRALYAAKVVKIDVWNQTFVTWGKQNSFQGEPFFVKNPDSCREDDGCLIIVTLDGVEKNSALVILDARSMSELARATLPVSLPFGFHGTFIPGTEC